METRRPLIAEIKRNSLDDGPGIRSVVFFKGCPLSCVWCHNPECREPGPRLLWNSDRCIGCGRCGEVCPEGAVRVGPAVHRVDTARCSVCGLCSGECPTGALEVVGAYYSLEELAGILRRDKVFYDHSGGGVTLSGGEPTLYPEYVSGLCQRLASEKIDILLETCGFFDWSRVAEKLLPALSYVFVDLKFVEASSHRRFTGQDNAPILANIERLVAIERPQTLVRVPLIPDAVAVPENLKAIALWLSERNVRRVALLPYNPLWVSKARALGMTVRYDRQTWMTEQELEDARRVFRDFEILGSLADKSPVVKQGGGPSVGSRLAGESSA